MSNRFSAVKNQMDENLKKKGLTPDYLDEEAALDEVDAGSAATASATDDHKENHAPVDLKPSDRNRTRVAEIPAARSEIYPAKAQLTRKTTAIPLKYDLAVKELKERRNLKAKQTGGAAGKTKFTEDDIMVEALELYFNRTGEYADCLAAAENKLSVIA